MKNNEIVFDNQDNYFELNPNETSEYIIKNQPDCFIEDDDKVFINLQPANEPENKKSHSSSLKTNATYDGDLVQNDNEFFSFNGNNNYNNYIQIKQDKEMSKESIDILSNFIQKEKNILSIKNNNININLNYENNNIKDIKVNLANINEKIYTYFKKPYMRKNLKKNNKNILDIKNFFDCNNIEEDEKINEKIKFEEKNELKDDDSKTNDSVEEECDLFDKKKFK